MSDAPPDHLCANERSKFYNADVLQRGVGVRFKGVEKDNVEEYCVSEGWVRVTVGKARDRRGNPMTLKLSGEVEVYFRSPLADPAPNEDTPIDDKATDAKATDAKATDAKATESKSLDR